MLTPSAKEQTENILCEADKRFHELTIDHNPDEVHITDNGQMIGNVSVTVDGTYIKNCCCLCSVDGNRRSFRLCC